MIPVSRPYAHRSPPFLQKQLLLKLATTTRRLRAKQGGGWAADPAPHQLYLLNVTQSHVTSLGDGRTAGGRFACLRLSLNPRMPQYSPVPLTTLQSPRSGAVSGSWPGCRDCIVHSRWLKSQNSHIDRGLSTMICKMAYSTHESMVGV